ncbi:hypothetical protein JIK52_30390 (plasmid) [Klebsiella variicola]|nr:hypothetical protein [Klebsiella variicola]QQM89096.1 hypothetical protein JIK52_30390 [Klebsiella variicola]
MEHVKGKIQQGAGNAYFAGMQWRGITLDTPMLQRLISLISISAKLRHRSTHWLLQNKAEFIALIWALKS